MIILEDSEEAVNGLAKLIIQEPRIIVELKIIRNSLKNYDVLSEVAKDEKYLEEKLKIISKAEEIANKDLWYGFKLHDTFNRDDNGFMLYQLIDNMMVPLEKDFEGGFHSHIRHWEDLEQIIEHKKINNLITYDVQDFDKVYSQQYEIEDVEEGNPIDYQGQHLSIDGTFLNLLREKGIKVTEYNYEQVKEFEKNLKLVLN
jgi:hypothetical protein